jgi:asparagine synthase (glutamine-hydrolysing)
MLSCLSKRGPDDRGFSRFTEAIVGQTRLSIVDILGGHQPMSDNKNPHTIVFNGEIYGFNGLRNVLAEKGHIFTTHSDTEVILKAYAEYGKECVKYIDGMFAFAIWDEEKKEMFVARDRFGKKPFYFTNIHNTFIAASEIKSIFATNLVKGIIDPSAVGDFLQHMYVAPNRTIYKNIHTLLPAHAGIVKDGKLETWRYWDLKKKKTTVSREDAKQTIEKLFDDAVKKRMVADVEIGTFLSGGVDSTLVTYYAQKYSSSPIKTFSVGYEGPNNELPFALEAAKKIGSDHYSLNITADLINELETIIEYMDEPHADTSNFPQHLISKLAASKVKVVLTGDGADELFMGYGWYQKHWHIPLWKPSRHLSNPFTTNQNIIAVFNTSEIKSLLKTSITPNNFKTEIVKGLKNPIEKINAFDLKYYLPGQLLTKIDRTSMMHSLEARSPFLDTALAEYVYNLPVEFKISKNENKIILKEILSEIFPKEFVYRRKQGFGAPIKAWLNEKKMRSYVDNLFSENSSAFCYIDKEKVIEIKNVFYAGKTEYAGKLWTLLCLLVWFKKHTKDHETTH